VTSRRKALAWIDPGIDRMEKLKELLRAFSQDMMTCYAVDISPASKRYFSLPHCQSLELHPTFSPLRRGHQKT
jgi:hypothetical protein